MKIDSKLNLVFMCILFIMHKKAENIETIAIANLDSEYLFV